jgi:hypothetical protein
LSGSNPTPDVFRISGNFSFAAIEHESHNENQPAAEPRTLSTAGGSAAP